MTDQEMVNRINLAVDELNELLKKASDEGLSLEVKASEQLDHGKYLRKDLVTAPKVRVSCLRRLN